MCNKGLQAVITTICLIRHGETDWNLSGRLQGSEDIELNHTGRMQAIQLADYLKRETWDMIISSPLKRAYETAQIIATGLSLPEIKVKDELIERCYGAASGLLPEERRRLFSDGTIPGQEEFEKLRKRAMEALDNTVKENAGKRILMVSHGALTNSILYTLSGGQFGSYTTRLKNGCINLLIHAGSNWSVVFYNKTTDELPYAF